MSEPSNTLILDAELENKYESGRFNLLQQHERIKLPLLAQTIQFNPRPMNIDPNWSSSWDAVKRGHIDRIADY